MAAPRRSRKPDVPELSRAFVARRHELGLTQSDLAVIAGVGRSTVQAVEGGKDSFQLDGASAIAEALGCDLILMTRSGRIVDPNQEQ